jgi:hypothetical protein
MDWLQSQTISIQKDQDGMSLDFEFLNDFPLPMCVQVIHRQFVERDRMNASLRVCCLPNSLPHIRLLNATNKQVDVAVTCQACIGKHPVGISTKALFIMNVGFVVFTVPNTNTNLLTCDTVQSDVC